jgi:hypothetical protein
MRAETTAGKEYFLYLDREEEELNHLRHGVLECRLADLSGEDLGKRVTLAFEDNEGIEGLAIQYLPQGATPDTAEEVRVTINAKAYAKIAGNGSIITQHGESMISVINGLPRETRFG